jgi:hypothetical protein
MRYFIVAKQLKSGDGNFNVFSKSLFDTRSSPYIQLPIGTDESLTHCPYLHDLPESHGVPSSAPIPIYKKKCLKLFFKCSWLRNLG